MCIRDSYRYDLLNVLPDDLFQQDSPDIVSAALVLVDSMGGADEEDVYKRQYHLRLELYLLYRMAQENMGRSYR